MNRLPIILILLMIFFVVNLFSRNVHAQTVDLVIEVVPYYEKLKVKIVPYYEDEKWKIVGGCYNRPNLKIKLVPYYENLKVKIVPYYEDRKVCISNIKDLDQDTLRKLKLID